eukprot:g9788.t1
MRQRPRTAEGVRSLTNDSPGFRAASHASHLFTAQATAFKRRPQTASGANNKGSYSLMCWLNEKPFEEGREPDKPFAKRFQEDLKHCTASLTRGVVKFAQVVGVFPGPKFDDAEGADQGEADCAENLSFRVDKAWRQRCSQRFRNVLDMIAKKADHSVLRLLQISQQHIESQLERVKHERELWKEVVERRQQQPLQLALSMKEQTAGPSQ